MIVGKHQAFIERFQKKEIPDDLVVQTIECDSEINMSQILKQAGLTQSTSEAMRLVKQGAVKINGVKLADAGLVLSQNNTYIIQVGKQRIAKLFLKSLKK